MLEPRVYSVAQINRYIRGIFDNDIILQSLWVKGEISNYKRHSSGHLYFTLKDKNGAISCIMFRGSSQILPFEPENGMEVIICGYVGVYEKTGQYQLYAELMQPVGAGSLAVAFEQMKTKLSTEGLFDNDFKREICKTPKTIAVITSPTGAAIRDIINIAKRRNNGVQIVVVPVLVQGEMAAKCIADAIKHVNEWGKADTIIIGRGGGSIEDLWAFNEEIVARAIFASETPVISAVGHETDFTIADFVSDSRAPTPSAAAELAINDLQGDLDKLNALRLRVGFAVSKVLENQKNRVTVLIKSRAFKHPQENLANNLILLDRQKRDMEKALLLNLERKQKKFYHLTGRLELLSPMGTLKRGYSATFNNDSKLISSVKDVKKGDRLRIKVSDGTIEAVTEGTVEG
ncbi:MAG: exodeoxyribonuclease VII large subunit [Anaerotignaceae bacterium]